ncbi:MAG: TonB-dependent receptor [Bacteroidales bacterium]|nr:TonB-dependent receptor [Bacteroidales bacterium]
MNKFYLLLFILISFIKVVFAQQDTSSKYIELFDMDLEQLSNTKITTSTKTPEKIREAPSIIRVITQKNIREHGYNSVGEALSQIPGFSIINDYLSPNISVRGINGGMRAWSKIIKVMIDGQPVSFRPSTANFLGRDLIPINLIKRIEVITGPGSALYGANAFLGVVNIITKKGEDIAGGYASVEGNLINNNIGEETSIVVGEKYKNIDFVIGASRSKINSSGLQIPESSPYYSIFQGEKSHNDISQPKTFYGKFIFENKKIGTFTLNGNYQNLDTYGEFQDWSILTGENRYSIYNSFFKTQFDKKITEKISGTAFLAFSKGGPNSNDHLDYGSPDYWRKREFGYKGIDAEIEIKQSINEKLNLTYGVNYAIDDENLQTLWSVNKLTNEKTLFGQEFGDTIFSNLGIYLQSRYKPNSKINLIAGVRFDKHNIYSNVINYRIGSVFQLPNNRYFKLLYGTSFKAPAAEQLYTSNLIAGGVYGNPNLYPEKAKTGEILFSVINKKNIAVVLNSFYSVIDDKVEIGQVVGHSAPINSTRINSYGIESELHWKINNLSGYSNISYQHTEKDKNNLTNDEIRISLTPELIISNYINYSIPNYHLSFAISHKYIGNCKASEINIIYKGEVYNLNAYNMMNINISTVNLNLIKKKETIFSAKINNLLNTEYAMPGFRGVDIPSLGRNFSLKIVQMF